MDPGIFQSIAGRPDPIVNLGRLFYMYHRVSRSFPGASQNMHDEILGSFFIARAGYLYSKPLSIWRTLFKRLNRQLGLQGLIPGPHSLALYFKAPMMAPQRLLRSSQGFSMAGNEPMMGHISRIMKASHFQTTPTAKQQEGCPLLRIHSSSRNSSISTGQRIWREWFILVN